MSRTIVSTIALSMSAACAATLVTACGTEASQAEPLTKAEETAESAHSYVDGDHGEIDPAQRRFLAVYFSDRAMSDVWQRHPELIGRPAEPTDLGRPPARPGVREHPADPFRQDPQTSAEAWTRRLEALQGRHG